MRWNQLISKRASGLLAGIDSHAYFYFAHSYAAFDSNGHSSATCTHGAEFTAVVEQQNIFAVQFHPEQSGGPGARVLQTFLRICR